MGEVVKTKKMCKKYNPKGQFKKYRTLPQNFMQDYQMTEEPSDLRINSFEQLGLTDPF